MNTIELHEFNLEDADASLELNVLRDVNAAIDELNPFRPVQKIDMADVGNAVRTNPQGTNRAKLFFAIRQLAQERLLQLTNEILDERDETLRLYGDRIRQSRKKIYAHTAKPVSLYKSEISKRKVTALTFKSLNLKRRSSNLWLESCQNYIENLRSERNLITECAKTMSTFDQFDLVRRQVDLAVVGIWTSAGISITTFFYEHGSELWTVLAGAFCDLLVNVIGLTFPLQIG